MAKKIWGVYREGIQSPTYNMLGNAPVMNAVWQSGSGWPQPFQKYDTREQAMEAAKAAAERGETAYVMEAVSVVKPVKEITVTDLDG